MRVITGSARGMRLMTLEGEDVRPTTGKVKESAFNIIQFDVENSSFLDLFAGSGQMSVEALSRGAASATLVDASKRSVAVINQNLKTTSLAQKAEVKNMDSIFFLNYTQKKYDIAYLDPPFSIGLLQSALEKISNVMNENGIVLCESPKDENISDVYPGLKLEKQYTYGKLMLSKFIVERETEQP